MPLFHVFISVLVVTSVFADRASFDCPMRQLAIEFAAATNPTLSATRLLQIADALDGSPEKTAGCHVTMPTELLSTRASIGRFGVFDVPTNASAASGTYYVDYMRGSDSADGSQGTPFKTVAAALAATRRSGGGGGIILRQGVCRYKARRLQ